MGILMRRVAAIPQIKMHPAYSAGKRIAPKGKQKFNFKVELHTAMRFPAQYAQNT